MHHTFLLVYLPNNEYSSFTDGLRILLYAFLLRYSQDELEIIGRVLGKKGGYSGTSILVKNKATGELIAEGRHSLFGKYASKM